jgi:hypothetical protein
VVVACTISQENRIGYQKKKIAVEKICHEKYCEYSFRIDQAKAIWSRKYNIVESMQACIHHVPQSVIQFILLTCKWTAPYSMKIFRS